MTIKIQAFKRKNGSKVHTTTLPKHIIDDSGFSKGTELEVSLDKDNRIIMSEVK